MRWKPSEWTANFSDFLQNSTVITQVATFNQPYFAKPTSCGITQRDYVILEATHLWHCIVLIFLPKYVIDERWNFIPISSSNEKSLDFAANIKLCLSVLLLLPMPKSWFYLYLSSSTLGPFYIWRWICRASSRGKYTFLYENSTPLPSRKRVMG